jgi:hypothetical protein
LPDEGAADPRWALQGGSGNPTTIEACDRAAEIEDFLGAGWSDERVAGKEKNLVEVT